MGQRTPAKVTGLALGVTEIHLRDQNVAPEDVVKPPTADLHIVAPSYITLGINPHQNWNVAMGNDYEIVVEIFDSDNNRLYASDNIVMEVTLPGEYFRVSLNK